MSTLHEVAEMLNLSAQQVRNHVNDGVIPQISRGEYDMQAAVHGYISFLRKRADGQGSITLVDQRTRLTKAQANLAEIALEEQKGKLLRAKVAEQVWTKIIYAARQRMLAIPTKIAPLVASMKNVGQVKHTIEEQIHECLSELSSPELSGNGDGAVGDFHQPSKKNNKKEMR